MAKYRITPSSKAIIQLPISIGHKAEKGVEAIEFDLTAWVETYGSGTLTVIMRRWGDAIPYPIALEIDENNKATWTLSDIDTAKAGMAYAQLSYVVGDEVVKKSDIYTFRVMDSLTGEGDPPEAYESWLEHLTHLAAEAMAEVLDIEGIVTDKTLTIDGGIADGKATGDALALKADKSTTYTKTEVDALIDEVEVETDTTLTISGAPADAAETGRQIGLLKADLEQFTSITPIAWTHGAYVALSNSTADPSNPTSNASWMYAVVPCVEGDVFYINSNGGVSPRAWGFLDSSNNVLSRATGSANVTNTTLKAPENSVCLVLNNNDVSVSSNYVSYKGAPVADVVSFIESDINDINSELPHVFTALYNDNRIIYTTGVARHTWAGSSNGSITFHVGSYLVTRLSNDNGNKAWADISTSISDSIVIDGDEADITITANHSLVYNTTDKQLKIRALGTSDANHIDDILLISVAWAVPISGLLYEEYISRLAQDTSDAGNISADVVRAQSFNSAFHTGATDFVTKCQQFSTLLLGDTVNSVDAPTDFETFLFFTDPHLVDGSNWQKQCYEFVAQIQKYYNSTPTNFCLVGGDWLGTGDIPTVACYKMGYIDGFMRSMFDNCYMLVGNHDTNYQGRKDSESAIYTTRLSNQSIVDLWYRRKDNKAYYTFDGARTRFYCFDTGTEAQTMDAYNNYGWTQADWFANALLTDNSAHIAVTMHILYHSYDSSDLSSGVQALSTWVLKIAQAYNARTAITVNGTSYDYTNATGKVEFCIAGHTHFDANGMLYDIPWVISSNVRHDVSKGATFDLCFVDYDNAEMTMVRVGDGSDRIISLATGGIVN